MNSQQGGKSASALFGAIKKTGGVLGVEHLELMPGVPGDDEACYQACRMLGRAAMHVRAGRDDEALSVCEQLYRQAGAGLWGQPTV
jgi:hypothetical protein